MADEVKKPNYAPEKYIWLKRRIALDLLAIDEELQEIGVLIQEAGEHVAFCMETRDAAKDELARTEAQAAARLRNITGPDGKVPSDTRIVSMIPLDEQVMAMQQVYGMAKLDCALWTNISDALRTKSSSMRAAADLVQAGFISMDYITTKRRTAIRQAGPTTTQRAQVI